MKVQSNMHEDGTRKKRKVHTLRETAIDAGLEAIKRLSEAPAPAVKPTARTAITAWLPAIVAEQARGTSLLRIYNDVKKAAGLRISYRSFQNYVSKAALEAGLRPERQGKEAAPPARPMPDAKPSPAIVCPDCGSDTFSRDPVPDCVNVYAWACKAPDCLMVYEDENGHVGQKAGSMKEE